MNRLASLLFLYLLPLAGWANHIVGGDISLLALDKNKPGYYRIQVIQYWETAALQGNTNQDPIINILIFRKRDPILIQKLQVDLRTTTPLIYDNAACATLLNIKTTQAIYYRDYQFDINKYTDPDGYYIVWERCCRNNSPTNLASSINLGIMLYMEFPPMSLTETPNSSPVFSLPNGAYICINKPFTFDFSATDADGDQLRYSLVTPLQGYTTPQQIIPDDLPKTTYPVVAWEKGFNEQNAIPGNPPLRVNVTTGQLSVQASQLGVFLFTVQVEEYRNGQRIGLTRRDFQLPVVDCTPKKPPVALIQINGQPVTEVNLCENHAITLTTDNNPIYAYQWQKNGVNLTGMTSFSISVRDTGTYAVVKRYATTCAGDTLSPVVRVKRIATPSVKLSTSRQAPFCAGDTIILQAIGQPYYQYSWNRSGQIITNEHNSTLRAFQSGVYVLSAQVAGATCTGTDTLQLTFSPRPDVRLQASATSFCEGDSVVLEVADGSGYQYRWAPISSNQNHRLIIKQGGTFQVIVTTPMGCSAISEPMFIHQKARPNVQLDSISPFCGTGSTPVPLIGSPVGGIYTGVGVEGDEFVPAKAGAGLHKVSYAITSSEGCRAEAVRWVGVSPDIQITLPPTYHIVKGSSVRLDPFINTSVKQAVWVPPMTLDKPDSLRPMASPDITTVYTLTITNVEGCNGTAIVTVEVAEQLYIPTAFSPNGDGFNDVWELRNTSAFPTCEVIVYDRWGEVIFSSTGYTQPWDGTCRQLPVEPGVYSYRIQPSQDDSFSYTGQVVVMK